MRCSRVFLGWMFLGTLVPLSYAPPIQVTGTVRDFSSSHPDFEGSISGFTPGMLGHAYLDQFGAVNGSWTNANNLTAAKNPIYNPVGGSGGVQSAASFQQWFNDVPGVNMSAPLSLTLNETVPGTGIYQYENSNFFPIDGQLGNENTDGHNYHFTFELNLQFTYSNLRNNFFEFTGDDDVWVYINNILVIDIGGVHGPLSRSIDLDDHLAALGLANNGTYDLDIYFAERHTSQSNFKMTTSLALGGGNTEVVPEPFTMSLMGLGAAAYIRRRVAKKKAA